MDYVLRDIDLVLWSKANERRTLERKSMRKVLFESLEWYISTPAKLSLKKKKGEKKG